MIQVAKNKINLQIIAPTKQILNEEVDSAVLSTLEGDMGVWYDHEPVVTLLKYDIIKYTKEGVVKKATVMGGFAQVTTDAITILTDAGELEEDIDAARARLAMERAKERIGKTDYDTTRAEIALQRALVRLKVAGQA